MSYYWANVSLFPPLGAAASTGGLLGVTLPSDPKNVGSNPVINVWTFLFESIICSPKQ